MTARELFGVIVRAIGVFVAVYGTYTLSYTVAHFLYPEMPVHSSSAALAMAGGIYLLIGLLLLGCADLIVRFAYGRAR